MIIFLFAINICSAIKISEIELNPAGTDKGNEWIELFSDEKINFYYALKLPEEFLENPYLIQNDNT